MPPSFTGAVRDSLSNLAASLNAGKDKAANDSFVLFSLDRGQIEAMVRGDWLARKVVDIVPSDMVREWRAWSGHRADVERVEAAERRLGLRQAVQRAMTLGRLYGGGAIIIGTGETDPAALAQPLDPDRLPPGGLAFLHVVSRWQLSVPAIDRDPLSPWFGEAESYDVVAPGRGALRLHPSRVVRFLGNPYPDPSLMASVWSDSVLQTLYDAIHAVALTTAGANSLMHEAKVDVVTVPNLSEHLSSADTTAQLSARFAYAAAMKSINNLLLLGDGESWARQKIDFAGLPEMVRTFLQVAAGAADIPVTRLLGQSPSGLSATGESDTRNYYDMIAARQEIDLRPQLERLDRLILRSERIEPSALTFAFRPLWQMDAAAKAAVALSKAQATQIYAGLGLWPADVTARLVAAQVIADGIYPNAAAVFAAAGTAPVGDARAVIDLSVASLGPSAVGEGSFAEEEPRDWHGRWTTGAGGGGSPDAPFTLAGLHPEERRRRRAERRRKRARRREREGEATTHYGDPEEREEPQHPRSARRKPARPPDDAQTPMPSTSNSPSLAHSPPTELDLHSLDPNHGLSPDLREELKLRPSPPNITFTVSGNNTTELGNSYSEQVRNSMEAELPPAPDGPGSSVPDGLIVDHTPSETVAIEAKYVEDWAESLYNPDLQRSFPHNAVQENIQQAMKYHKAYPDGIEYVTNSLDFVKTYAKLFSEAGIKNFHFTIIPAVRR